MVKSHNWVKSLKISYTKGYNVDSILGGVEFYISSNESPNWTESVAVLSPLSEPDDSRSRQQIT